MASRDFHRVSTDVRAWLGGVVGSGDGYAAWTRRNALRRWGLVALVLLGFVAIAIGGYAIGASQVGDVDSARQAGMEAGEQRGSAVGTREGYGKAFRAAREQAFEPAYRDAYRSAYLGEFDQADLSAPGHVPVSGP
jgi:hypothetical protein